jgi:hypothetical protein
MGLLSIGVREGYNSYRSRAPIHLEQPEWYSSVAYDPEKITKSRLKLFRRAVS